MVIDTEGGDMNILITGGAGFIGSHLSRYLISKGHKITILDNFSNSSPANIRDMLLNKHVRLIKGDVRDANIVWRLDPVNDHETLLVCDTILVPDFYAPESIVEEELRDSAEKAVLLMRGRAEADYTAQQKKANSAVVVKPK